MTRGAVAVLLTTLALAAPQMSLADPGAGAVFGYYNPRTHTFTVAPQQATAGGTPSSKSVVANGTIIIDATVALNPSITAKATVGAYVAISTSDSTYSNSVSGYAGVSRKGSTATVTATLPYRFTLTSASETLAVELNVYAQGISSEPSVTITQSVPLPANGKTTTVSFKERL